MAGQRKAINGVESRVNLDLRFIPATNYLQLRRAALEIGAAVSLDLAWIDLPEANLIVLPQR